MPRHGVLKPYKPKDRYIPKKSAHEESIQRQVCTYLRRQYPHVIFRTDFTAGRIVLTPNQGRQYAALQSGSGFPDLMILEPSRSFHGLLLELKRDGTTIILKTGPRKGKISSNLHIQAQALVINQLRHKGYYANFAIGLDDAIQQIDWYFNKPVSATLF